jgi:hypothetical protein
MAGQNMLRNLNAAKGRVPAGAAGGRFNPLGAFFGGGGLTSGLLLGEFVTAPMAVGLGNYLRSPQGVLAKDRLRQGDIGGAFSAVTGLGRSNAPRLEQYNPPGFDPGQPVTIADLRKTVEEIGPIGNDPASRRNYESEKRRAEQLAAQDQLAKKYDVANLTKAYNTASTPEEKEKIGLQIWATTNPQLAQKLKPGQLGYEETQAVAASQSPLGGAMKAVGDMQYADKISFGAVPATDFGVGLQTPLTGMQVPTLPQVGVAESFKGNIPGGVSFAEAAELFSPETLSQTQQALLKQAFEKGLKNKK